MPKGVYTRTLRSRFSGVYAVLNIETGETYIGSSKDVLGRIYHHTRYIKDGNHQIPKIRLAVEEYGSEAFTFVVLESCSSEIREERETHWLQTLLPEYNTFLTARPIGNQNGLGHIGRGQPGNRNALGVKWSDEMRSRHSEIIKAAWSRRKLVTS